MTFAVPRFIEQQATQLSPPSGIFTQDPLEIVSAGEILFPAKGDYRIQGSFNLVMNGDSLTTGLAWLIYKVNGVEQQRFRLGPCTVAGTSNTIVYIFTLPPMTFNVTDPTTENFSFDFELDGSDANNSFNTTDSKIYLTLDRFIT